jgi:hypothetical protein
VTHAVTAASTAHRRCVRPDLFVEPAVGGSLVGVLSQGVGPFTRRHACDIDSKSPQSRRRSIFSALRLRRRQQSPRSRPRRRRPTSSRPTDWLLLSEPKPGGSFSRCYARADVGQVPVPAVGSVARQGPVRVPALFERRRPPNPLPAPLVGCVAHRRSRSRPSSPRTRTYLVIPLVFANNQP